MVASPGELPATTTRIRALGPYAFPFAMAIYFPILLFVDGSGVSLRTQHLFGVLTFAIVFIATRFSPRQERHLIWIAIVLWTCVELFASLGWGLYTYRLGNVPLFVPPGHGLIYLCGLRFSRTPFFVRHSDKIRYGVVGFGGAWAVAGLTLLPLFTGTIRFAGAILWPVLAICVLASQSGSFYASIFIAASILEIIGTLAGVWAWSPVQRYTGFPSGNPPSAVAAAYCVFDLVMMWVAAAIFRGAGRRSPSSIVRIVR